MKGLCKVLKYKDSLKANRTAWSDIFILSLGSDSSPTARVDDTQKTESKINVNISDAYCRICLLRGIQCFLITPQLLQYSSWSK